MRLQETGMYDFGWRQYMPDIGRWNGMDQLSEMYAPISPYAYVANNPVSLMDPDGRKIEPIYDKDDKITGWTFTEGDATAVGGYLKYGGDWGKLASQLDEYGSNFGTGPLSTFWNTFNSNGAMIWANSVSTGDIGGTLSNGVIALGEATITSKGTSFEEWVKDITQKFTDIANNQYFSVGHLIASESVSRFGAYSLNKALIPDHSVNYTLLDDAAKPLRTTTILGRVVKPNTAKALSVGARYGGAALAVVSIGATELQYADGQIGKTERWVNHIMTGVGVIPTPWTMGAALLYGVVTGGYQAATGRSIFNDLGLGPQ